MRNSQHRDIPSCDPLFVFGHGLSYTTFDISNLKLTSTSVAPRGSTWASVDVTNTGTLTGDEVVQLYINDPVASISQPVRRLRGFQRVTLEPGKTRNGSFTLDRSDFGFYDNRGKLVVEPGPIDVYAGNSSSASMKLSFTVTRSRRAHQHARRDTAGGPELRKPPATPTAWPAASIRRRFLLSGARSRPAPGGPSPPACRLPCRS
jgi:hypothetical protein